MFGLNGRAYAAAGQTVASLHTKAYQTDLLKDLDKVCCGNFFLTNIITE